MSQTLAADLVEVPYGADVLRFSEVDHTYFLNDREMPSVTQILKQAGYCRPWNGDGSAAWKGRHCHSATLYEDHDDLDWDRLDPVLQPYVAGWRLFKAETGFVPDLSLAERPCYHKFMRYGGTPDRPGMAKAQRVVVEIKSGAPEPWHLLQSVAYVQMLASHDEVWTAARPWLVYLTDKGTYRIMPATDKVLRNLWPAIVSTVQGRALYGSR